MFVMLFHDSRGRHHIVTFFSNVSGLSLVVEIVYRVRRVSRLRFLLLNILFPHKGQ